MTGSGTGPDGRIITFYSYKGGTGRTMALANVAWLLATNGYRVLAIDWDLESPGLHRYFHPFLRDKQLKSSDGILDLVRRHSERALRGEAGSSRVHIQEYAASLDWEFPRGGLLDFVGAGRLDLGYAKAVSTFDWDSFWHQGQGRQLLRALREDMTSRYDFVLIDSRTGTSDTGGICTVYLPDVVVNCFTLNTQSIAGAAAITQSIVDMNPDITVYPVPTRIEDGEKAKLERGRTSSRRTFEPHLKFLGAESADGYWNSVEVPYIPYYAYEEILAAFGDTPGQNGRLLGPYVRLASRLAGHDCPADTIPEADRNRVLGAFEQTVPRDKRAVVVAYAPLDRIWAEWLRDRLDSSTHSALLHNIRDSALDLDKVEDLLVIYSRDFLAREGGERLLRRIRDRLGADTPSTAALLRVDATPLERRVPPRALVDVMGAAEDRVLEMTSLALGLDPVLRPHPAPTADSIRFPADRAPHFEVGLNRNPRFSGRGGVIEGIRERLLARRPDGAQLALIGLPGVGKTQTALEYCYRFAAAYDGIWWISAAQPARVRLTLANVATQLGLPGDDVEEQIAAVLDAFRTAAPVRRWLVVLDNVDDPAELRGLLPAGPGHLLVTSRNPRWADALESLDLGVFKRAESVELLGRRVQGVARSDADRLANRLGDLPLALEQAGGLLSTTGMAVTDYLDLLDHRAAEAMSENAPATYDQTVASTVGLAYDRLAANNPAATRLIELLAFLAPEVIPYRMISNKQMTTLLAPIDPTMHDPARHVALVQEIGRLGLARVNAGVNEAGPERRGVVVHRLTQDIVRSRLSEKAHKDRRREIQSVLAETDRGNPDNAENRAKYEAIRPHLETSGALSSAEPETRQLIIDMTRYLFNRGDFVGCRDLAEAALREWLPRSGDDDVSVLRLRRNLALALSGMGRDAEAYAMNEDSLARLRRTLGDDDPYTLATAMILAADLRARGEYEKAAALDRRTLDGFREVYGDDNPDTLNAANNLAVSLRLVGDFRQAERLDRDTLERRRKILGIDHERSNSSRENTGADLIELGELEAARNMLETAYGTSIRNGESPFRTIRIAHTYSVALRRLSLVDKAADVIDDAVRRALHVLRSQHRLTLSCQLEQADVRWAQGRVDEARAIGEQVYQTFRETRGADHPETMVFAHDLAIFRREAGNLEGALQLAEQTFDRLETLFAPAHPYTVASTITLANAQFAIGQRHLAAKTDADVLGRLRRAAYADDHPALLAALSNWALSHQDTDPAGAARYSEEAVVKLVDKFGPDHPSTRAAQQGRRIDQDIAPFAV
ncbi:FxSxx-COOH system tetratricopeptide repeat protein [Symbioplanes lichenis]|uniref:FxSxx-COOH system tetratricopeptide repeat protein n=1 Tax=Symbioplanes lichenis TaxID=1629072 RepID=UPI002738CC70|nr:FxSxx-COOH system tetratricopeptide repeat protein [Actinoplanes lichenis]